jgi:tetratricopeptide (TPR) repeat protein
LKPDHATAYYNKGNTLQALNRLDEALTCYDNAIRLKPDYADAYYNKGITLKALNRLDEALTCYDNAIRLKPDYALCHCNKGKLLLDLGRQNEASNEFKITTSLVNRNIWGDNVSEGNKRFIRDTLESVKNITSTLDKIVDKSNPEMVAITKIIEEKATNFAFSKVSDQTQSKTTSNKQAPSQQDIIKALVASNEDHSSQMTFILDLLMQQQERLDRLEAASATASGKNVTKVGYVLDIKYDNELLNHPKLLELSIEKLGLKEVIDGVLNLSQDIISEIVASSDQELTLAGLMSIAAPDA